MAKMGKVIDVTNLGREEQLELLDQLWEQLGRDPNALPLNDEMREELDRRLNALDAEGPVGIPWNEVAARIRSHQ